MAPLAFVLLAGVGFFATYGWARANDHVSAVPMWPYVSDTGDKPPESCLFTLLIVWSAAFVFVAMYLYYKYIQHCGLAPTANKIGIVTGFFTSFGMTIVGSFQFSQVKTVHLTGAGIAFVAAVIYSWIVIYIDVKYKVNDDGGRPMTILRIVIATLDTISLVGVCVGYLIWNDSPDQPMLKNIPTIFEWFLIYLAILFMSTLVYEIRRLKQIDIGVVFVRHPEQHRPDAERPEKRSVTSEM